MRFFVLENELGEPSFSTASFTLKRTIVLAERMNQSIGNKETVEEMLARGFKLAYYEAERVKYENYVAPRK